MKTSRKIKTNKTFFFIILFLSSCSHSYFRKCITRCALPPVKVSLCPKKISSFHRHWTSHITSTDRHSEREKKITKIFHFKRSKENRQRCFWPSALFYQVWWGNCPFYKTLLFEVNQRKKIANIIHTQLNFILEKNFQMECDCGVDSIGTIETHITWFGLRLQSIGADCVWSDNGIASFEASRNLYHKLQCGRNAVAGSRSEEWHQQNNRIARSVEIQWRRPHQPLDLLEKSIAGEVEPVERFGQCHQYGVRQLW